MSPPWPSKSEKSCLNEAVVAIISPTPTSCLSTLLSFSCIGREEEEEKGKGKLHYEKIALLFLFSSRAVHMTKTHRKCNSGPIHRIIKSW
ncbi:hypothetical protein ACE6H2_016873 [Prunus campanulata]